MTPSEKRRTGAKKATRISVHSEKQITATMARFRLQGPVLTFRDLRQQLNAKHGVSMGIGTVYRLAHGYDPQKPELRRALGLPTYRPAPVCACGEVHVSKRCPNKPRMPAKPRTKWKQVAQELADALEPARLFVAYANFEAGYPGGSFRKKDVLPKIEAALARAGRNCPPVD